MPTATLCGVITKLYFVIFAAFKESITVKYRSEVIQVVHFGGNRKPMYGFIWGINSNFRSIFNRFGDIADFVHPVPNFHTLLLFRLKFEVFTMEQIHDVGVCREKKG